MGGERSPKQRVWAVGHGFTRALGHGQLISRYASGEGVSKVGRGGLTLNT